MEGREGDFKVVYNNNHDGLLIYQFGIEIEDNVNSFIEIKENGYIELADTDFLTYNYRNKKLKESEIGFSKLESRLLEVLNRIFSTVFSQKLLKYPYRLSITLVNAKGFTIEHGYNELKVDSNHINLGYFKIYNYEDSSLIKNKISKIFQELINKYSMLPRRY